MAGYRSQIPVDGLPLLLAGRLQVPGIMRAFQEKGLTIVSYHGVVPDEAWRDWETADMIAESVFRQHLSLYRRHYQVIGLRQAINSLYADKGGLPARALAITFDDGYRNNLVYAVPTLKEYGLTAAFFITTGFVDRTSELWWLPIKKLIVLRAQQMRAVELDGLGSWFAGSREDAGRNYQEMLTTLKTLTADKRIAVVEDARQQLEGLSDPFAGIYEPLTWDELRLMHREGMEIGAHTVVHPILARETDGQVRLEIEGSVRKVKEELGLRGPLAFAYPDGQREDCQPRIESIVSQSDCYAGLANYSGINRPQANRYQLRRYPVGGHHTPMRLELDLCGLRSLKSRLSSSLMRGRSAALDQNSSRNTAG